MSYNGNIKLLLGDCLDRLKELDDNSVDSIVTDPPYGLGKEPDIVDVMTSWVKCGYHEVKGGGFMGKEWDSFVPQPILWKEVYRVLKPGGYMLVACGTRTQDWMASSLRFAGFEIRDIVAWVYGSGFPKSMNISKNIYKSIDNFKKFDTYSKDIYELWKNVNLDIVKHAEQLSPKQQIDAGNHITKKNTVVKSAPVSDTQLKLESNAIIAEVNLIETCHTLEGHTTIVVNPADLLQTQMLLNANTVDLKYENQILTSSTPNIISVPINAHPLLEEKIMDSLKVDVVQKIYNGNVRYLNEMDINVQYAEIIKNLKPIILNYVQNTPSCGMLSQTELPTVINVIITVSTMELLISSMVDILKNHVAEFDGRGTALKPAMELWTLCRKPLSEPTVADNVLKWGTGGINIDGCRIATDETITNHSRGSDSAVSKGIYGYSKAQETHQTNGQTLGRWPANIILDEEAGELLDEQSGVSKSIKGNKRTADISNPIKLNNSTEVQVNCEYDDMGGASRFFYCPKVSKSERNEGLGDDFYILNDGVALEILEKIKKYL
jgi:hypothetical protein